MAWCKVSSLSAAVARSLKGLKYPATRAAVMKAADGKVLEGWDLSYFLGRALSHRSYADQRAILLDIEDWIEKQG